MIIFPAIDIQGGKVVRLLQGRFDRATEYAQDPVKTAQEWQKKGARWLHVVDLDGARTGEIQNGDIIAAMARSVSIPIQVGGGIRTGKDVEALLHQGVARVILGTRAVEDKDFLEKISTAWPQKIAVSADCSNGFLAQRGWTQISRIKITDFVKTLEGLDLSCLVYTDIARDGMLTGPNWEGLKCLLAATRIPVIASGGISSLADIQRLAGMEADGLKGVIIGKALYDGKINLEEALRLCSPSA